MPPILCFFTFWENNLVFLSLASSHLPGSSYGPTICPRETDPGMITWLSIPLQNPLDESQQYSTTEIWSLVSNPLSPHNMHPELCCSPLYWGLAESNLILYCEPKKCFDSCWNLYLPQYLPVLTDNSNVVQLEIGGGPCEFAVLSHHQTPHCPSYHFGILKACM